MRLEPLAVEAAVFLLLFRKYKDTTGNRNQLRRHVEWNADVGFWARSSVG